MGYLLIHMFQRLSPLLLNSLCNEKKCNECHSPSNQDADQPSYRCVGVEDLHLELDSKGSRFFIDDSKRLSLQFSKGLCN